MTSAGGFAHTLEAWGAPGVALAAALDAFVPLAHVVDPLVVVLSYRTRNAVLYAAAAALGSTAGTTLLFRIVRAGGDVLVGRRMDPERLARLEAQVGRHGPLAVFVGGVLPPPFPFKALVLLAATLRMPLHRFAAAVLAARAIRYGLEATLAVYLGDDVLRFMKQRYPWIGLTIVSITVLGALAARLTRKVNPPLTVDG